MDMVTVTSPNSPSDPAAEFKAGTLTIKNPTVDNDYDL